MNAKPKKISGETGSRAIVELLPKAASLSEVILDLVDNCVDGAMRQRRGILRDPEAYDGLWCSLTLSKEEFRITDNCGGIPREHFEDAFRIGRPEIDVDGDIPTMGMQGIGMKRAVFKLGSEAAIQSISDEIATTVEYGEEWLSPQNRDYSLFMLDREEKEAENGVTIHITKLKPEATELFDHPGYQGRLAHFIAKRFAYVIKRGFKIYFNGSPLGALTVGVLTSEDIQSGIQPYNYIGSTVDTEVRVTVGLYRNLMTEREFEESADDSHAAERAGITVICNERVIVHLDRTAITGWGWGAPDFHARFRPIAGIMSFTSNDVTNIPISSLKQGMDVDFPLYRHARNATVEGLLMFISFLHVWMGREDRVNDIIDGSRYVDALRESMAHLHGEYSSSQGIYANVFLPNLPRPKSAGEDRRMVFSRDQDDIEIVSESLFGDADHMPGEVAAACFDLYLGNLKKRNSKAERSRV